MLGLLAKAYLSTIKLTRFSPVLRLHRNQSIDLQSKSVDWFWYNPNRAILYVLYGTFRQHTGYFAIYILLKKST